MSKSTRLAGDSRPVFPEVRGAFGYDADAVSDETGLECRDESLTVQSQREEADINVIMRRFGVTGDLPTVEVPPLFQDFGDLVFDYQSAQNLVVAAQRSFMQLDAKVRTRFGNDPQEFVAFVSDPENVDECVKMGLAIKKALPDNAPVADSPPKEGVVGKQGGAKSSGSVSGAGAGAKAPGESGGSGT